ncbi:MAG: hypothetical protein M3T56_09450, partial [Chloroflexota bacterium]|nr:hypothetical protein [Chloroflexota bacterium]
GRTYGNETCHVCAGIDDIWKALKDVEAKGGYDPIGPGEEVEGEVDILDGLNLPIPIQAPRDDDEVSAKKTKKPRRTSALSQKMVDDAEKHGLYEALDLTAEEVHAVEWAAEEARLHPEKLGDVGELTAGDDELLKGVEIDEDRKAGPKDSKKKKKLSK